MKKVIVLTLILICVLAFTGCNKDKDAELKVGDIYEYSTEIMKVEFEITEEGVIERYTREFQSMTQSQDNSSEEPTVRQNEYKLTFTDNNAGYAKCIVHEGEELLRIKAISKNEIQVYKYSSNTENGKCELISSVSAVLKK